MITTLTNTTASAVDRTMGEMRETFGANALGRVLTLIIVTTGAEFDNALAAAVHASHEHPSRVLVVHQDPRRTGPSLDAEIRVGRDAGAGEIVILHVGTDSQASLDTLVMPLLLPDAPIVTWWPKNPPSAPANDVLGAMSQRRITDAVASKDPMQTMQRLRSGYRKGDTDLAWARITKWRGLLATAYEVRPVSRPSSVTVAGNLENPTVTLLASWLEHSLEIDVELQDASADAAGVHEVRIRREDGDIVLRRSGETILMSLPHGGEEAGQQVAIPHRSLPDLISEELRRLDPDVVYGEVLAHAFDRIQDPSEFVAGKPNPMTEVFTSKEELAKGAATRIAEQLKQAIDARGIAHLVVTGGSIGTATAAALPDALHAAAVNTSALHLWWGDERFLPAGSEDRNDQAVQSALLDQLSLPENQIHRMPAAGEGMTLEQAATWYGQQLDAAGGDVPFYTSGRSFFDVLMLGVGPDMHVASLFPEHPDQKRLGSSAIAVRNSPKPPEARISLSWPVLNSARHVALLAAGEEKAEAVATAMGMCDAWLSPASSVRGTEDTVWYLDAAAASRIDGPHADGDGKPGEAGAEQSSSSD